jgi:hypothetical protein
LLGNRDDFRTVAVHWFDFVEIVSRKHLKNLLILKVNKEYMKAIFLFLSSPKGFAR